MGQHVIVGGYRIGTVARQTGLGPVHEAVSPKDEPVHVLLLRRPEQVPEDAWQRTVATFDADLKAAAGLKHPNVIPIRGVGEENGVHFVVMEPVPGETLAERIVREGSPVLARVAPRFAQICGALGEAHAKGIVHGDLSPDDIVITPEGNAQLGNFGMAHIRRQALNRYMSPEVVEGELPDALSDLFSLGAILYEMVSGRPAFPGVTTQQLRDAITGSRPVEPLVEQPAYVQAIVLKALSRKREARYQAAAEMLADLRAKRQPAGYDRLVVTAAGEAAARDVEWQPAPGQDERHAQALESAVAVAESIQGVTAPPKPRASRRWLRPAVMAVALLAVLGVLKHAGGLAQRATVLEVVHVRGTASSFRLVTEVPKSLATGAPITVGDTIRTGADTSLILRASDGTVLRVGSNTRLTVTSLAFDAGSRRRNRQVYLQKGRVVVRAAKQRPGSILAVTTPRARVSVTGTLFSVDAPNGLATTVDVLQGATQVAGASAQQSVAAGQEAQVTASGEVEDPEALPEDQKKLLQEALEELKKLEGQFADFEQALANFEEAALVPGLDGILKAVRQTGKGHEGEIGDAGAVAKAAASMVSICSALETAACEGEGEYPEKLNLSTLEELGLPKENALMMLDSFRGEKLESYTRSGSSYEFTARAKDKNGTLLKATQGRVSQETGSGEKEKHGDE